MVIPVSASRCTKRRGEKSILQKAAARNDATNYLLIHKLLNFVSTMLLSPSPNPDNRVRSFSTEDAMKTPPPPPQQERIYRRGY
jgi:hypothetical protein